MVQNPLAHVIRSLVASPAIAVSKRKKPSRRMLILPDVMAWILLRWALAFVRRQPFVASTLLGATTMEQLKTNVESLHLELSEDVLAEIEAVHQVYTYPAP
ncbi:putative aldo/keto reductase [Escherichia coli]|uniref:Putative aldo/keto reductase n=1 Tax=Escherichia coli TaxID=562 RepID=A0A3S4P3A9_ECOLX|nr:putative aldo/keto reductase [Escherichia coli]